jgi:hypothetical protein
MTDMKRLRRIPGQTIPCGWCRRPIEVQPIGRLPKWCSANCRHRAWEQRRANASQRAQIEVVDRVVEVEVEKVVPRIEKVTVEVMPKGRGWAKHLDELVKQIESGRVYDRDLLELAEALSTAKAALEKRPGWDRMLRRRTHVPRNRSVFAPRNS